MLIDLSLTWQAGDEVFNSYLHGARDGRGVDVAPESLPRRQRVLPLLQYLFRCRCPLCTTQRHEECQRRQELRTAGQYVSDSDSDSDSDSVCDSEAESDP
jgi:hypothetical protein